MHHFLLRDPEGLPFGLAGANFRFTNPMFLLSPMFWYGVRGLQTRLRKLSVALMMIAATLIALFIGPSSAVLVIPTIGEWPAGGTSFWMSGNASELWPLTLNVASVGGNTCLNATED